MNAKNIGNPGVQSYRFYKDPGSVSAMPLEVPIGVHSVWKKGDFHKRQGSNEFWIEFLTVGEILFTQNNVEHTVCAPAIFFTHKKTEYFFIVGKSNIICKRSLSLEGALLDTLLSQCGLDTCDVIPLKSALEKMEIMALFKKCDFLLEKKPHDFCIQLSMVALGLLIKLGDYRKENHSFPVRAALQFLKRNISCILADKDIALASGKSIAHFHRIFKSEIKVSPMHYFITLKMGHAKGLLSLTPMTIKEIAHSLGYEEPAYFTETFKIVYKISPTEFRLQTGRDE